MSVIEKIRALDEQRTKLLEGAKKEALDDAHKAIAELKELGFDYELVEHGMRKRAPSKTASDAPKRQISDKECDICHFKTSPPHDGRKHRGQKPKKPFTLEELMEKKLAKL